MPLIRLAQYEDTLTLSSRHRDHFSTYYLSLYNMYFSRKLFSQSELFELRSRLTSLLITVMRILIQMHFPSRIICALRERMNFPYVLHTAALLYIKSIVSQEQVCRVVHGMDREYFMSCSAHVDTSKLNINKHIAYR